jgi:hypothetical protein
MRLVPDACYRGGVSYSAADGPVRCPVIAPAAGTSTLGFFEQIFIRASSYKGHPIRGPLLQKASGDLSPGSAGE